MDKNNSSTPKNADIRDLPNLDGFVLSRHVTVFSDGSNNRVEDIEAFEAYWRQIGAMHLSVEVNLANLNFVRDQSLLVSEEWLEADTQVTLLDPIEIRDVTLPSGTKVKEVFVPLRKPIALSQLIQ